MWFEILPPAVIMMVALAIPAQVLHYSQKYFLGTPFKRSLLNPGEFYFYNRDERLSGDAYKALGLESVPDE